MIPGTFFSTHTTACHDKLKLNLKQKDTTNTEMSASYLDIHLEIDSDAVEERIFTTKEMLSIFPL